MREEEGRGSEEEGKVGVGGEESGREVGCVEEERRVGGGRWEVGEERGGRGVGVGVGVV